MSAKVTGQATIFLGTACGPALTPEQREFLTTVKPNEWYPVEKLREILDTAKAKDVRILNAAGKSWGQVIKQRLEEVGIDNPTDAMVAVCDVYTRDHQGGEVGKIVPVDPTPTSLTLHDTSIYPHEMLSGTWVGLTKAYKATDVQVEISDLEGGGIKYEITWKNRI